MTEKTTSFVGRRRQLLRWIILLLLLTIALAGTYHFITGPTRTINMAEISALWMRLTKMGVDLMEGPNIKPRNIENQHKQHMDSDVTSSKISTTVDNNDEYFQADGVVTGAGPEVEELSQVLSHWESHHFHGNWTPPQLIIGRYEIHAFDVRAFGAVGDGMTLNTQAFQDAFREASKHAGDDSISNENSGDNGSSNRNNNHNHHNNRTRLGIVVVQNGLYRIGGSIDLWNYAFLYVHASATIVASFLEDDYPYPQSWENEGNPLYPNGTLPILVRSKHQHHVGIFGSGIIDGSAVPGFVDAYNATTDHFDPRTFRVPSCQGECRPQLVLLEHSSSALILNVTLQNSPDWTLHLRGSRHILVTRVTIHGDWRWPNNDGIDIDSCHDVTIRHSTIHTADDAICIKTTQGYGTTRNLHIHDLALKSRSSAMKIGSSTQEDVSNILIEHVTIETSSGRGLAIQHRDAGHVSRIHFRHITIQGTAIQPWRWWGLGEAIYITSNPRYTSPQKQWTLGTVSHITLENITANSVMGTSLISSRPFQNNETNTQQQQQQHVSDIVLKGVNLCVQRDGPWDPTGRIQFPPASIDYRPTDIGAARELQPYPRHQQIAWYLDHLPPKRGVKFYDSHVYFPPGNRHNRTPVCVSPSMPHPGLTCHVNVPCFATL